ncbi:CDGSH iron-sulfur domain-containing protein 1-like [Carcharodon carcharias]|uniref:CDGSH iron-sulfur domain-containing protein 1-like n=1 Tax=Carcharodon carcharias TaxID=13397 RepID=UPI001B7E6CB8|nr:CDGSH iron-sulfur domain-containing protein 1-like [Carcharodon carcharias]
MRPYGHVTVQEESTLCIKAFINLKISEICAAVRARIVFPLTIGVMISGYLLYRMINSKIAKNGKVNRAISKDVAQVVHSFDVEDLGEKTALCRCWRSDKFPYCDGAHVKHNLETRDNVGPLIITKSP